MMTKRGFYGVSWTLPRTNTSIDHYRAGVRRILTERLGTGKSSISTACPFFAFAMGLNGGQGSSLMGVRRPPPPHCERQGSILAQPCAASFFFFFFFFWFFFFFLSARPQAGLRSEFSPSLPREISVFESGF